MVLKFHLKILLIALFHATQFFDTFTLAQEPFSKALRSLEPFVLLNNNLCEKLISSLVLPIAFNKRFNVTSVPFFIPDYNLLSCELDNFTFKVLY